MLDFTWHRLLIAASIVGAGACSDEPTAPQQDVPFAPILSGAVSAGGQLIAVGSYTRYPTLAGAVILPSDSALLMYSADGVSWHRADAGTSGTLTDVAWGKGVFVAVGEALFPSGAVILRSTSGRHWSPVSIEAALALGDITYAGGRFVALGVDRASQQLATMVSVDAQQWSVHPQPAMQAQRVTGGGGRFVAWGGTGAVFTSSDGAEWARVEPEGFSRVLSLEYVAGAFRGLAEAGCCYFRSLVPPPMLAIDSPDGESWTSTPLQQLLTLSDISFNGSSWLGIYGGAVFASSDRLSWSLVLEQPQLLTRVVQHEGRAVALGVNVIITRAAGRYIVQQIPDR